MTLFAQLVEQTSDDRQKLSSVLLRAKVLASDIPARSFRQWVTLELNGYPTAKDVPPYRKLFAYLHGHFMGPFGSAMRNVRLPTNHFEPNLQELFNTQFVGAGIAEVEGIVATEQPSLTLRLSENLEHLYRLRPGVQIDGMQLADILRFVSVPAFRAILSSVRARLLDFLLELKDKYPGLGRSSEQLSLLSAKEVTETLKHTIFKDCTFYGSDMGDNLNIGGSIQAGRDVIIAARIRNSFNALPTADAKPELAKLLKELFDAVAEVAPTLPADGANELAENVETLGKEVVKAEPRRKWFDLSAAGIVEAAGKVGEAGMKLVTLVGAIGTLLGFEIPKV